MRFLYMKDSSLLWDAVAIAANLNVPVYEVWKIEKELHEQGTAYACGLKIKLEKNGYARIYKHFKPVGNEINV